MTLQESEKLKEALFAPNSPCEGRLINFARVQGNTENWRLEIIASDTSAEPHKAIDESMRLKKFMEGVLGRAPNDDEVMVKSFGAAAREIDGFRRV